MPEVIWQPRKIIPARKKLSYQSDELKSGIIIPERKEKIDIIPLEVYRQKAILAEPTGRGTDLIMDVKFGRMFLSEAGVVEDVLNKFVEVYEERCERFDEDPAHSYIELTTVNELNAMLGIIPSTIGDEFAWSNTDEYRVKLQFDYGWMEDGEWVKRFGTKYFWFDTKDGCEPESYEYLMEVC